MEFKETRGARIPLIGFGTYGLGRDPSNDKRDIEAIQFAIECGLTHIDTAARYTRGYTEELVGEAISIFARSKLFVTTKVWVDNLRYGDILSSCKGSLQRLRTSYIDLYLIHWPNPDIPLGESLSAMDKLVDEGLVRFIGVSNFGLARLKEAETLARHDIFSNQVEYSLVKREPESELLPYCQQNGILLIAYSPLGQGIIRAGSNVVVDRLAQKYQRTPAQIALNYLISHDNVIAIPKASEKEHIKENSEASGWRLEEEDVKLLEKES